jgi:SAM-dependent MidA family methyltransferase
VGFQFVFRRVITNPPGDCKNSPPLDVILRAEIERVGPISCARFMEFALYHPNWGYYERDGSVVGQRGDFYTSVSVGELFGQLLAFQFAEWLDSFRASCPGHEHYQILEAGAHDGQLAEDILLWLHRQRPDLMSRIQYWILDPSTRRQEWQRNRLSVFAPRVRWFANWGEVQAAGGVNGFIFANELLDSFPVHRLAWSAGEQRWFEWGVRHAAERFVWTRLPELTSAVAELRQPSTALSTLPVSLRESGWANLAAVLPDGFILECSPFAERWWQIGAHTLRHGKMLTLDYGHTTAEAINPARPAGTLRSYRDHQVVDDILAAPGEQDITAHVNFAVIKQAGERAGLATVELLEQSRFLSRIAQRTMNQTSGFGEWNHERARQFQTLAHPDHLGRSFTVLLQERD